MNINTESIIGVAEHVNFIESLCICHRVSDCTFLKDVLHLNLVYRSETFVRTSILSRADVSKTSKIVSCTIIIIIYYIVYYDELYKELIIVYCTMCYRVLKFGFSGRQRNRANPVRR